jgi:hypothetical protein
LQLAADGRIGRGRPRGSWISSQYRWAPMEASPAIDEAAVAPRDWIGPVRVTPRLRTPLERELGG